MHHFIYSTKDSWISSGSSHIDGTSFKDQNFGQDEILELKKEFWNLGFDYPTRILVDFTGTEFTEVSKSIAKGDITNPKFYLRLYEAEGNSDLSTEYKLASLPISQSWDEGRGKFGDTPKVTNGVSWENRSYPDGGTNISWSYTGDVNAHGAATGSSNISASSQTFSYQSPDVEMDITDMTRGWLSGSNYEEGLNNYGLLLRFSGSQERDSETFGHLKFFSRNTHTIYPPKLEVKWDDHTSCTGNNTGSLTQLSMSGAQDNYLYMIGLRDTYRETEKVKFRVGARKRYITKNFDESVQTVTGSYIAEQSGSYSILDVATGETIIPFKDVDDNTYTYLSCDSTSNYFNQWLNGFQPNRIYKIIYKIKYDDNQEVIYDNDWEFKVIN